jgi:hypothetical protein
MKEYFYQAVRLLYKWLNRRSQRKSLTWDEFNNRIAKVIPPPRVVHDLYHMNRWKTPAGSRMV